MKDSNLVLISLMGTLLTQVAFAVDPSVIIYLEKMSQIAPKYLNQMQHESWKDLVDLITPEVLEDAHSKSGEIQQLLVAGIQPEFKDKELKIFSRPQKKMERINIKKSVNRPDVPYKLNSDFSGFRIFVEPTEIKKTIEVIEGVVARKGGRLFIRNSIEETKNNVAQITDIVQYCFMYLPEFGYVTEIQVGHPFAFYTFTYDDKKRDARDEEQKKRILDLFNNDFYGRMKSKILDSSFNMDVKAELEKVVAGKEHDGQIFEILKPYLVK